MNGSSRTQNRISLGAPRSLHLSYLPHYAPSLTVDPAYGPESVPSLLLFLACSHLFIFQTYRELSVAIPALEKSTDGIVNEGYDTPILIFKSNRDKVPELGAWEGDTWEGRKITFSM